MQTSCTSCTTSWETWSICLAAYLRDSRPDLQQVQFSKGWNGTTWCAVMPCQGGRWVSCVTGICYCVKRQPVCVCGACEVHRGGDGWSFFMWFIPLHTQVPPVRRFGCSFVGCGLPHTCILWLNSFRYVFKIKQFSTGCDKILASVRKVVRRPQLIYFTFSNLLKLSLKLSSVVLSFCRYNQQMQVADPHIKQRLSMHFIL